MRYNKFYLLALAVPLVSALFSQGCENTTRFANTAPGELALVASKCFIATGGTVHLVGDANDDDGDSLTFYWKASKGSFTPSSATGVAVDWKAPSEPGAAVITMTVTDELVRVSKAVSITVCTRLPSTVTSSFTIENTGYVYILMNTEPLMIPSIATLTIEPGVTIVIDSEAGGIATFGRLEARGEKGSKIKMQGNTCSGGSGLWAGVYLYEATAQGTLANAEITMSKYGIQVADGAKLTMDSCEIYNNEDTGIGVLNAGSRAEIHSCQIWDNGTGVYVRNGEADIRRSSIRYSAGNGIELSFSLDATPVAIDSCSIGNNGFSGIFLSERAAPEIHHCSIFSNGENPGEGNYGVRLASYAAYDSIQAQNNYWGVNMDTETEISTAIYDAGDNPSQLNAYVDFTPWLNEGPVVTTSGDERCAKGMPWARLWR